MNDKHIISISQIRELLKVESKISFHAVSKKEKYNWIGEILGRFKYFSLRKKDRGIIKRYVEQMTGLRKAQLTKLINRKKKMGRLFLFSTKRHSFPTKYTPTDIARLIETDNLHLRMSGPATCEILRREYEIFNQKKYERIKNISSSHVYNLRNTRQYQSHSLTFTKTQARQIPIGERRRPSPYGKPGYLRVDSVHQGDLEKEKGVYHINLVDEVTQWEIVGSIEKISEYFLIPLLKDLLEQFPFVILGFHSDNGSEYINKVVANLLNKLLITQTKSRARHTNDNALVESKNGSIIRKHIGYQYINRKYAPILNQFYKEYLNIYLNYHRPSGFATIRIDKKGKEKKKYDIYQTPYEGLKSLPDSKQYLKSGITFKGLDQIAYQKSDNQFAALMKEEKKKLFINFNRKKLQFPTIYTTPISGYYVN